MSNAEEGGGGNGEDEEDKDKRGRVRQSGNHIGINRDMCTSPYRATPHLYIIFRDPSPRPLGYKKSRFYPTLKQICDTMGVYRHTHTLRIEPCKLGKFEYKRVCFFLFLLFQKHILQQISPIFGLKSSQSNPSPI